MFQAMQSVVTGPDQEESKNEEVFSAENNNFSFN